MLLENYGLINNEYSTELLYYSYLIADHWHATEIVILIKN